MHPTTERTDTWTRAGSAWGHAAKDWAILFEPHARDAFEFVLDATQVGSGTGLVDIACGSGMALARAARLGADVTGLDASAELLAIAADRVPSAELVHGDMFDLPWGENVFDVASSFNGIWGGCDAAVVEMARVTRPGGFVAITFWGRPERLDLRDSMIMLGRSDGQTKRELISTGSIGVPGVAESMFEVAGIDVVARGETVSVLEWLDDTMAVRALRSTGVARPVVEVLGEEEFAARTVDAVAPFKRPDGSYRLHNEITHLIGRVR